jgi:hypothetical protein
MTLTAPLAPLVAYRQWIIYRLQPGAKLGKTDKIPCDPRTGRIFERDSGGAMNPAHHVTYAEARHAQVAHRADGVGFVFLASDPFWFVDADDAWDGTEWSATARDVQSLLAGAACELSQSGRGLHWIGSGTPPPHACKNIGLGLELYHENRFVALTDRTYGGDASYDATAVLPALVDRYFKPTLTGPLDGWTTEPKPDWDTTLTDDAELLRRARATQTSAQRFGAPPGGRPDVSFAQLWDGDSDALAARWPGTNGPYDASSADAALATHLAFWTGHNCERIESLMRQSALVRDKWERADYMQATVLRAVATSSGYARARQVPDVPAIEPDAAVAAAAGVPFGTFIPPAAYPTYFADCAYIIANERIHTPRGVLVGATSFDTLYGGKRFILDAEGGKTTASAWEAFRQCQLWRPPIADATCFRPEEPPNSLIESEGRQLLNTYVPIETQRIAGDATPFLDLLHKLLPVETDRQILLSYFAALVQNPGRKFQWWPVIQGAEGNGKTLIAACVAHAVGHRYTHMVNPEAMARTGNQFNKWVQGNLFVVIEEIYMAQRRDFLESFKATVTNPRIALEGKGADQITGDNRVNGAMFTNHKDGVPVTVDTRRYAVFYTPQQCAADIERDGMGGAYFPDLYDWLNGRGRYHNYGPNYGFAVVNDYLRTYEPVAAYNPAGLCQRAPETSSTASARRWGLGRAEQWIQEAIDEGRPGFAGGWVSSAALDQLLEHIRVVVAPNKRRELMRALGYDWHPALPEGRTHNAIPPDNRKVRLYVKDGHLARNLTEGAEIARQYAKAQDVASVQGGSVRTA